MRKNNQAAINMIATTTQAALMAVHTAAAAADNAKGMVKAGKEAARQAASSWFVSWFNEGQDLEGIPAALSSNANALDKAGFFGSHEAKVKEGSRKSVASHNREAALRFFQRVWKAEYSESFSVILTGSTSMQFEELVPNAEKTTAERLIETATKGGLFTARAEKLAAMFGDLMREQEEETAALLSIAEEQKAAADKAKDGELELAAAQAMSNLLGITLEQALQEIAARRAA